MKSLWSEGRDHWRCHLLSPSQAQAGPGLRSGSLVGRLRQENRLNPGDRGCGEPRSRDCTPAWATRVKLRLKKKKKRRKKRKCFSSFPRWLGSICRDLGVMKCCRVLPLQWRWEQRRQTLTTQSPFTLPLQKSWSHFVENQETRVAGSGTHRSSEMKQIITLTYCLSFMYFFILIRIFW